MQSPRPDEILFVNWVKMKQQTTSLFLFFVFFAKPRIDMGWKRRAEGEKVLVKTNIFVVIAKELMFGGVRNDFTRDWWKSIDSLAESDKRIKMRVKVLKFFGGMENDEFGNDHKSIFRFRHVWTFSQKCFLLISDQVIFKEFWLLGGENCNENWKST